MLAAGVGAQVPANDTARLVAGEQVNLSCTKRKRVIFRQNQINYRLWLARSMVTSAA